MFSARLKPLLAIALASIIWGGASPIFKWSLSNIPPFTLAFLRFSLAALFLYPFIYKKFYSQNNEQQRVASQKSSAYKIDHKDWPIIIFFGLSGVTFNITFFFLGLRLAPSINASLIGSIQPFLLLIVAGFYLREQVFKREILGTLISFLGILLIILSPLLFDGQTAGSSFWGNLFFFLAMLGATGQTLSGKKLFNKYPSSLPLTFYAFTIGALTFFPLFLVEYLKNPGWLGSLDKAGAFGIFYGVIFSSLLAYVLYDWGLSKIQASESGILNYLNPLTAILIAVPIFGEKITWPFLLGSLFVLIGIFLTERRLPYHPLYKHKEN